MAAAVAQFDDMKSPSREREPRRLRVDAVVCCAGKTHLLLRGRCRPLGLEHVPITGTLVGLPVVAFLATLMPPIAVGIGNDARRGAGAEGE